MSKDVTESTVQCANAKSRTVTTTDSMPCLGSNCRWCNSQRKEEGCKGVINVNCDMIARCQRGEEMRQSIAEMFDQPISIKSPSEFAQRWFHNLNEGTNRVEMNVIDNITMQVPETDFAIHLGGRGAGRSYLCKRDKIQVTDIDIIVSNVRPDNSPHPYYELKYKRVGCDHYDHGYGSYNLDYVRQWMQEEFIVVPEEELK